MNPVAPATWRDDARTAGLVSLGHAVSHFHQLAFAPLFPFWREQFGLSWTQLGLIMSLFYVVSCISQASAGFFVDRHGARRALLLGFALMALGTVIAATAGGYPGLLVASVVVALGNSVFHPANFSLMNHRVSERRMAHAYSLHGVSGTLGYASAPVMMVWLASVHGWRIALLLAASASIAMVLVVLVRGRDYAIDQDGSDSDSGPSVAGSVLPGAAAPVESMFGFFNPALAACMLFFVMVNIAGIGVQNMGASLLEGLGRMDAIDAASWITLYICSMAGGMVVGGFVASHNTRHDWVAAIGTVLAALMLLLLLHPAVSPALTGLLLCVAGASLGIVTPARDMLVRSAAPKKATGRAYGIVYSAVDIGAAIGPALMGCWLDHQMPAAGFVSASVALVLTAFSGWLIAAQVRRLKRPAEVPQAPVVPAGTVS